MRAPVPFLSLLFVVGLALSGVACGSASIKPGGVAGASGRAGAGGGAAEGGAGGSGAVTGAGGAAGGSASTACVLDSTQIDNCTLQ